MAKRSKGGPFDGNEDRAPAPEKFKQIWQANMEKIDLAKLVEDLDILKGVMRDRAETGEQVGSVTNVTCAIEAAMNRNGEKTLELLSKDAKLTLGIAKDIKVEVAASALKASLGHKL